MDDLNHIMKGFDVVFHFAAQQGISAGTSFENYVHNNITATHRLLEATHKIPELKGFVHISTSSIYGSVAYGNETVEVKPTSDYGVTKLAAEQLALSYHREIGLPVAIFAFFLWPLVKGEARELYHKLVKSILEDKLLHFTKGQSISAELHKC